MKKVLTFLMLCVSFALTAQSIQKTWRFSSIQNIDGKEIVSISKNDTFELSERNFKYTLASKDSLKSVGTYIRQNNLLIFNY